MRFKKKIQTTQQTVIVIIFFFLGSNYLICLKFLK